MMFQPWYHSLKNWFRVQSIQRRILFGFVLLSALSALAITVGSVAVSYYNGYSQAIDRLDSARSLKNAQILNWRNALQDELLLALNDSYNFEQIPIALKLANNNQFYDWYIEAIRKRLALLAGQSQEVEAYCLLDRNGQIVLCTETVEVKSGCSQADFFIAGAGAAYIELPFYDANASSSCWLEENAYKNSFVIVSRPVINTAGEPVGVIAGLVSAQTLSSILLDPTGLGADGKAALIDPGKGLLIADGQAGISFVSVENAAGYVENVEALALGGERSGVYQDYRSETVLGVVEAVPDSELKLVAEQNIASVFQSLWLNLLVSLGIGLGAVAVTAVTAVFITRSITSPIVQLAQAAKAISDGKLERAVETSGDDEIASLAQAFNNMTSQLRDLILNLEQRVGERTVELAAANQSLQRRALQLEAIAEASKKISSIVEMDELLTDLVMFICETFKYTDVRVYLLEDDALNLHAYSRKLETLLPTIALTMRCLNTDVINNGKYVLVNDVLNAPDFPTEGFEKFVQSELVVPLKIGTRILGTLDVVSTEVNVFSPEDVLLLHSVGDQIAIAVENSRLYQRSLELAVHEERSRLARDLHDSVVQSLYSLNLLISGWKRIVQNGGTSEVGEYFERAGEITHQALKEMRLMVFQLHPDALKWEGLASALHRRLEAVEHRAGVKTTLNASRLPSLPTKAEEALYHIAQEALNNALKHSGGKSVTIDIQVFDGAIELKVLDDGQGFDVSGQNAGGMGLANMRQRAEELHGELTIESAPDYGTKVKVLLPL
ncbi:MAG: HAMP domain-containing protein [Chloroflexi bacterium]|nr:HAMP domain-containing protein [Chloroflexota bacterium]